jgi:hypothetical protein
LVIFIHELIKTHYYMNHMIYAADARTGCPKGSPLGEHHSSCPSLYNLKKRITLEREPTGPHQTERIPRNYMIQLVKPDAYKAKAAKAAAPIRPAALTNAVGIAAAPVKGLGVLSTELEAEVVDGAE